MEPRRGRHRLRWPLVAVLLRVPVLVFALLLLAAAVSAGKFLVVGPYHFSAYTVAPIHPQGFSRQGRQLYLRVGDLHWSVARA